MFRRDKDKAIHIYVYNIYVCVHTHIYIYIYKYIHIYAYIYTMVIESRIHKANRLLWIRNPSGNYDCWAASVPAQYLEFQDLVK